MLSFDQISPKLECGVDEYLCFPCVGTKNIKANGKLVLEVFIQWHSLRGIPIMLGNGNVRNDMFLLCETSNAFIGAFCYSKIHFHPSGPFKSIKTMLKYVHVLLGLSPVWNCYPKGGHKKGIT